MKTVDPTYPRLTRRSFCAMALALPSLAFAHDDHGTADIIADAAVVSFDGTDLTLKLSIYNRSAHAVTLFAVSAPGAMGAEALFVTIDSSTQAEARATLRFEGAVPGIFTAVLDFGEDGQGPVLVMP
ncbi:MAG: hypothetical protein ACU0AU_04695 [Cognatishimia activa]|uniref:Copper chaperone PCu(A)C n=1 Tax=Cognatishimia activa TaxID=1715691 RepID=A0A975I7K8_9RHOB|nr:hypothetical protein [Cognatishimia activa]QTN34946.1 hypothetical protein HZ995_10615 [Cognatishimia activa]